MMAYHSVICFESVSTKPNTVQPAALLGQSMPHCCQRLSNGGGLSVCFISQMLVNNNLTQINRPHVPMQSNASLRSENCQIMMVKDCQNYELKIVKIMSQKIVKLWWPLTSTVICIKISDFNLPPSNNF